MTRLDPDGRSRIARDEQLPEIDYQAGADKLNRERRYPGWREGVHPELRVVWGTTELPFRNPEQQDAPPSATGDIVQGRPFVRMSHITYPPGWHGETFWSETTDVIWVISGELTVVTDAGDEVTLRQGDTLIQNATNKAHHNRGSVPAVIAAAMCASERVGPSPPPELCAN